jgi:hypothetical protein
MTGRSVLAVRKAAAAIAFCLWMTAIPHRPRKVAACAQFHAFAAKMPFASGGKRWLQTHRRDNEQ